MKRVILAVIISPAVAVIAWDAIARYYSEYGDEIPIPVENNLISTVDIGVLKCTEHQELPEKFVDFVTS